MGFADPVDYIVVSFEGDYAMLRKADEPDAQLIQVAIALLPDAACAASCSITPYCNKIAVGFIKTMDLLHIPAEFSIRSFHFASNRVQYNRWKK